MTRCRPCALCKMEKPPTRHHLTTKADPNSDRANLCRDCHNVVHRNFTRDELRYKYNTVEKLFNHEKIQSYLRAIDCLDYEGRYWRKVSDAELEWLEWIRYVYYQKPNIWMLFRNYGGNGGNGRRH